MLILDRYLLRQFIQIFAYCFISLAGLYIVIDAFGYLDDFTRFASEHGQNLLIVMGTYYGYRAIGFFDVTSGMLTLIAAMFTVALFQRYNEFTALQAAGIRKWRIIKPVMIAVVLIAGLAAANRELVIPNIREHLARKPQDLAGESGGEFDPQFDNKTDIMIRGKQTYADHQRINKPAFALPPALSEYGSKLLADDAFYQPANSIHPSGYLLKGVSTPKGLETKPSLKMNDETIVFTPLDNPWLKRDECFVASNITFEILASSSDYQRYASLIELIAGLRNPSLSIRSDTLVAIHSRIVQPVLDVLLLFLGLPLVLSRYNRNVFVAIGLCVVVVVGFYLIVLACQYLGSSYLISPALAAWLPLIIFLPLAVAISDPLRE